MVAEDYFADPNDWVRIRPDFLPVLDPAKERAGKEVARLTCARLAVAAGDKQWPFLRMAEAALACFQAFVDRVDPEKVGRLRRSQSVDSA